MFKVVLQGKDSEERTTGFLLQGMLLSIQKRP